MPAFRVIIKGEVSDAMTAAEDRGLQIELMNKHTKFDECVGIIRGETDKVVEWFCQANMYHAPYPVGTLMWYTLVVPCT